MIRTFFCTFLVVFTACTNNDTSAKKTLKDAVSSGTVHTAAADTIVTSAKPVMLNGCYQMIMKQDTANLRLQITDSTITGTLNFYLYHKDKNEGSIKGVLRNNMIYADYTFQSEGMTSVREVVFRLDNDVLVQGFGELTEKEGKIIFLNKNRLQFNEDNPFIKENCQ